MKKIIKKIASRDLFRFDVKHFLHFFVVFTVIFVALSVIILQTMTSGIYKSTDESIEKLVKNPLLLTNLVLHGNNSTTIFSDGSVVNQGNASDSSSVNSQISIFSPNQTVILYDKKGNKIVFIKNRRSEKSFGFLTGKRNCYPVQSLNWIN